MNLREGSRRLALLLGAAGAILCCLFSVAQLQSNMRQRAEHEQFEKLANSQAVRLEQRTRQLGWMIDDKLDPHPNLSLDPYQPSILNANGIKAIHWTDDFAIAYIETQEGQTLFPTPAPGAWSYLLIAILPPLGFLIPWSVIRAVGWALAGFVQPLK